MLTKVAVNTRYLTNPTSGIERYLTELIDRFGEHGCEIAPMSPRQFPTFSKFGRTLKQMKNLAWDRHMRSLGADLSKADLFHGPSFVVPKLRESMPSVVTVHDLAFLKYPEYFDRRTRFFLNTFFPASVREASRIICVSHNTAQDFAHFFPDLSEKLRVVHNGFSDFAQISPDESILGRLHIEPNNFLLCVGTFNARKNLTRIAGLAPELKKRFPGIKLVVVGRLPNKVPAEIDDSVIFTGFINDHELSTLYRNTRLFIYPSVYEGFGFPVLEAMSVGAPVVCSNTSCLPEISGLPDSEMFDPLNSKEIFDTLVRKLDEGRGSEQRGDNLLIQNRFSWAKMAKETVQVYRECLD